MAARQFSNCNPLKSVLVRSSCSMVAVLIAACVSDLFAALVEYSITARLCIPSARTSTHAWLQAHGLSVRKNELQLLQGLQQKFNFGFMLTELVLIRSQGKAKGRTT